MALFAFPGAAILIVRVFRFDFAKARRTDKDPAAILFDPDSIQCVVGGLAAVARFGSYTFDSCH